jgi:hypothetical protein
MDDPTAEFRFIPFTEVRDAPFSPDRIERGNLVDRIVFARTSLGNYAKFQVHGGRDLLIQRIVVYDPAGCIIRTASTVTIRGSYRCDLDNARESATGTDFWWEAVSDTENILVPVGGAVFHLYRGFDDATFDELRAATYSRQPVLRDFLLDQVLYCRSRRGHFAKLSVEAGPALVVRRLQVHGADGRIETIRTNFPVPSWHALDLDTGVVSAGDGDLLWDAISLTPIGTAGISCDSWYRFEAYNDLLNDAGIRAALLVGDASAPLRDYGGWTDAERWQLWEFIQLRAAGRALPIAGPPALLRRDAFDISHCDAWKIYLAHVAQSLWVDANALVPWRLSGAGAAQLEALLRMDTVVNQSPGHVSLGDTTQWNPQGSYSFLTGGLMVGSDHWSTIRNLVEWCRTNLIHATSWVSLGFASEQDYLGSVYGYRGPPLVERMIDPLPGQRRTSLGCWYTDSFLASLLRTVNVPIRQGITTFSGVAHSRAEFFTVGYNLAHGDDPYNGWTYTGGTARDARLVPVDRLFYGNSELAWLIDHPVPRPGLTLSETASYNAEGRQMALAIEFKTDYLLDLRRTDVGSRLTGHASQLWMALHGHYSDTAIDVIAADCDREIAALGG